MPVRVTAEEYAEKWGRRTAAAGPDVLKGVDRVKVAPGIKAAEAKELMRQKLLAALDDGTWEQMVKGVSLADWQEKTKTKGAPRIQSGITAAMPQQAAMAGKLISALNATEAEVNTVKRGTLEDNIQRANLQMRGMAKRKLRRPGS